jgi:hypothetical protein
MTLGRTHETNMIPVHWGGSNSDEPRRVTVVRFHDMSRSILLCAILIACSHAVSRDRKPVPMPPNQFEIGRHTFFDFGPPTDYYEVFVVRPAGNGSSVERITLTPPGNQCVSPAKVETASASINESPAELLGSTNLCAIPEKELRSEMKRCKHCLVFSGANVVVQAQCGDKTRLTRADILDRDMFDPAAKTPEHTSWTMQLVATLDREVGPGVMEKPIFQIPQRDEPPVPDSDSATLGDLSDGKYDALFRGGSGQAVRPISRRANAASPSDRTFND